MSVLQFPDTFYIQVLPSSGALCDGGTFTGATGELKTITCWIMVRGTSTGSESFRVSVYPDQDLLETSIAESTLVPITSFGVASDGYNYVRFDFADQNLNANNSYRLVLESTSYTRLNNDFYVGFLLDWPDPVNTQPSATEAGVKAAIVTDV